MSRTSPAGDLGGVRALLCLLALGCQVAPPVGLESGAPDLLLEVRRAVGADALFAEREGVTLFGSRVAAASTVDASSSDGERPLTVSYRPTGAFLVAVGAEGGETARGYDGDEAWIQDDRRVVTTQGLGGRELLIADGWLRTLLWLTPGIERFGVEVDEDASTDAEIVLRLERPGQRCEITVFVDRATHRPAAYSIERHGRERTVTFTDWREEGGAAYPATMTESLDGKTLYVDRFERRGAGTPRSFAPPASRPSDATYAPASASTPPTVAARVDRGGRFYARVAIDGDGEAWMLLDTAFGTHAISRARADALGLAGSGSVALSGVGGAGRAAWRTGESLSIGALTQSRPRFVELDTTFLSERAGFTVDGVLGAPLFERAVVALDDRRATIEVLDPSQGRALQLAWQPVRMDGASPCVRGRVRTADGETPAVWLRLDTGSDDTLTVARWAVREYDLEGDRATLSSRSLAGPFGEVLGWRKAGAGLEVAGVLVRGLEITLMRDAAPGPLSDPWIAGNVGMRALRERRIVLDLGRGRVWIGEDE